jgi:oligopeptidase B
VPHATHIHGQTLNDDYFWLREKSEPAVLRHLEAENAYAESLLRPTEDLQRRLYDEMLGHIKQTDLSVPYRLGAYSYYARTEEGKQYPIYARKASDDAPEEITLDLNALAEGHSYLGLGAYEVSDDGHLLAYALDTSGYRQYTLYLKDLRDGSVAAETIERVTSVAWAADNATLFYTTEDPVSKRTDRFWRRRPEGLAELVYEETDERFDIGTGRTNDRTFVLVAAYSKSTTEWRALRADTPDDAPSVIVARSEGHRYSVEHHGDSFYIVTNRGAVENRIVRAPDGAADEAHWTEVVPERPGVHVSDLDMFERYAIVRGRSGGFSNLEILDLATHELRAVAMPETAGTVGPQHNPDFAASVYRFAYTSLVSAPSVFELDLATGERRLLKATEVPNYDPSAYATEVRHARSYDGTLVPISLVYRADVPRDGTAPLLLYGYGSYGISIDPTFSAARLALLDRGVAFAVAHIRGGGELGERWRTAGHLRNKLNTFDDFIACAEFLIAENYTSAARLAIQGASAGGLLVGAVANMRPELFAAVVSQVPFVDVLNTMLDASLPLTTGEYLEWGDPNVPDDFAYMRRYSPYDNVSAQAYPATLVRVSLNDSQVPYWEGAKLVARLRQNDTGRRPIMLLTNFGAGHGGASGRYDHLHETALTYAFILAAIAADHTAPQP